MNKKGFTLVEMIVVIILIGVVAVVAIPGVIKIMTSQNEDRYKAHEKLIKQSLDLYTIRYKGDFDNNIDINRYRIDYQKLLDEKLLKENGVSCNGVIDLTKKKNNNYDYKYYLTCKDDKTAKNYTEKAGTEPNCNPTDCLIIGS